MVKAMLFGLVMAAGCGETTDAPEVATDVYEYECIADETHVFEEVKFTPGGWVDAQLWAHLNLDGDPIWADGNPGWTAYIPAINADGYPLATCTSDSGYERYSVFRLLVRR